LPASILPSSSRDGRLERLIGDNKARYYEVLEQSSHRWHESKHDPWPALNFLLFILTQACKEFEKRVGEIKSIPGEKTAVVVAAIQRQLGSFAVGDLKNACPGVSLDMIRHVLDQLRLEKKVRCLGRGRSSRWEKTGN